MILVKLPFVSDYLRGKNGDPLTFENIVEMLRYLRSKNFTLEMLSEFDFEEADDLPVVRGTNGINNKPHTYASTTV